MTAPVLEQIGDVAVRTSHDRNASPWSVGCETLDRAYAEFANYKSYVGELGVGSARIQSGWARCEQRKGKYDFAWLDEVVDGLNEQGVKPWMCLSYGNPLYGASKGLGSQIFTSKWNAVPCRSASLPANITVSFKAATLLVGAKGYAPEPTKVAVTASSGSVNSENYLPALSGTTAVVDAAAAARMEEEYIRWYDCSAKISGATKDTKITITTTGRHYIDDIVVTKD